jgi:WD40 repeat protein
MNRDRRKDPDAYGWPEETLVDRSGRSGGILGWVGGGLTLAVMVGLGLLAVRIAREPEKESARASFHREPSPLGSVVFAPDGRSVALGRSDGGLVIEDLIGGKPRELEAGTGMGVLLRGLAYSPDGLTLASGGGGPDVKLWDVASGSLLALLGGHSEPAVALAFSPDGQTLASGSLDGSIKLWDVATGRELADVAGHAKDVRGLAFSPDGQTLASGSLDGSARLWSVATGLELASIGDGDRRVFAVAFSPDGQTLALAMGASAAEPNGRVLLWSPSESRQPFRVLGLASVFAVAFSPDGKTLAAAGGDRVLKLWDIPTGQEFASVDGHDGFISSLAFSPDGRTIATAGQDNLVGLFELNPVRPRPASHRL